ncbi:probable kinetochore protein NUF2 [Penaeus chinensis]|uniref:probable kinetochore protein NUF2 n=1 Tax=Penaeus chinensis TaxID=139456 RepID=UPI001FB706B7|nr:probable kinetochore protein NUF2 [Penaeus chinensis]XP_047481599.1 probable kinetochore protein NUF2 [Penaeus chinensis]
MCDQIFNDEMLINTFSTVFDMKVTVQDMKQLKPDFVQKIYLLFIRDFGAGLEQIHQLPFDVSDSVQQYPDMYRSIMRTMALAKVINLFLKIMYNDDSFMSADLFDPKPRRTRRFFSLMMEFYYAANESTEQLNAIEEQVAIKREARQKQQENIEKNIAKLRQLKMENAENQIREEQELKRIAEVKEDLQKYQDTKLNLKSQLDEVKMIIATLGTTMKDVELEIIEGKERIEKLASQVVQASERQEIEERERKLAVCKNDNEKKSRRLAELKQSLQTFTSAHDLVKEQLLGVMQEIQQGVTKQKEYLAGLSQKDRSKGLILEETEDISMKIQQLMEQLASKQEKISLLHMSWKLKKESLQHEVNQRKSTLEEMRRNQTEDEIVLQDMEAEHAGISQEIQQLQEQLADFNHFIASHYQNILQAMEKHNSELQTVLTDLTETIYQAKGNN